MHPYANGACPTRTSLPSNRPRQPLVGPALSPLKPSLPPLENPFQVLTLGEVWDGLYDHYQAACGALVELRAVTDAYCLIDGAANAGALQETRQVYDDLQIELYLLEQELVRRKVVKPIRHKLVGTLYEGGLQPIYGGRWPGQVVTVVDFSHYLRVSQRQPGWGQVHIRSAKRRNLTRQLRYSWIGRWL